MKNVLKVTGILLLVVFAASCSNGILPNSSFQGSEDNGKCLVNFSVNKTISQSRTILPANPKLEDVKYFKISGKSNRGEVLDPTEVTITNGTGTVTLSYALWELTLEAYDNNTDNKKLLLKASTTIDLTNGAEDISFTLTEKGVTTPGSINISGTYVDNANLVKNADIALYNITTGLLITTTTSSADFNDAENSFTFTETSIAPGEYIIKVILKDANDNEYAVYSDVVKVAPGKETKGTISITEDLIGSKPTPPENLMAYLENNSEIDDGKYTVKLVWDDKSDNESEFRLTVTEYAGDGTEVETEEYSLLSSTESKDLELELGKLYDVTIAAINRINKSNFEDDMVSRGDADDDNNPDSTKYTKITEEKINRFFINYNLDGGTYATSGSESQTGGSIVEYYTYNSSSSYTLIVPKEIVEDPDSQEYPIIHKNNTPFVKWVEYGDNTSTKKETYDGFENYYVKAIYNKDSIINITIPGYKSLAKERITCTYGNPEKSCIYDSTNATTVIDAKTPQTLTLTFVPATGEEPVFKEFKIIVNGELVFENSKNVATDFINTINYEPGVYSVTAIAREAETDIWYSYTFGIKIAR